jgi:hypothetical protein
MLLRMQVPTMLTLPAGPLHPAVVLVCAQPDGVLEKWIVDWQLPLLWQASGQPLLAAGYWAHCLLLLE